MTLAQTWGKLAETGMNALQVDPTTGFLTADDARSFSANKKVEFLAIGRKFAESNLLPNLGKMCDEVGIDYDTFNKHLHEDDNFRREWEAIKKRTYFGLAHELSVKANTKGGIIANLAALKYLERGKFSDDPDSKESIDYRDIKRLAEALSGNKQPVIATDAEIISSAL